MGSQGDETTMIKEIVYWMWVAAVAVFAVCVFMDVRAMRKSNFYTGWHLAMNASMVVVVGLGFAFVLI